MILDVACQDNLNSARYVYLDDKKQYVGLTIGIGSYIVDAALEFGSMRGHVLVGNYSSIGHRVKFISGLNHNGNFISTYPFRDLLGEATDLAVNTYFESNHNQIIIGNDVWIGADVTILGGVRIGNGVIIGTGAIVARDVPPYAVVAGNPAVVKKYRFSPEIIELLQKLKWWNWDMDRIVSHWREFEQPVAFLQKYAAAVQAEQPALEENGVVRAVRDLHNAGYTICYLRPDMYSSEQVWEYALAKMKKRLNKGKILLVLGIDEKQLALAEEKVLSQKMSDCGMNNVVVVDSMYETALLRMADILLTTKECAYSYLLDGISKNCRVMYAYDLQ